MNKIVKIIVGLVLVGLALFFIGTPYLNNSQQQIQIDQIMTSSLKNNTTSFSSSNFLNLPYIVKKYLKKSVKKKSHLPSSCTFTAFGKTKKDKNSEWVETSSRNYYSASAPNFLSVVETKRLSFFWTETVMSYINNEATTTSKFLSSIVTDSFEGNKLNKSYLVLYLSQSVFCPSVLLPNMNVHWKKIDRTKAMATIWDDNLKGSAIFHFNENGEVTKIVTEDRYMPGDLDYKRERFTLHLANYKNVDNFHIPTFFEYQWNLAGEDFTFGRFQISEISYK